MSTTSRSTRQSATSTGRFDAIGVVLGVVAAVIYAAATIVQKRLLGYVDVATMTIIGCLAGTLACVSFARAVALAGVALATVRFRAARGSVASGR